MTPQELFSAECSRPQWVHGSDVGMDESGRLWVRADAELRPHLGARVSTLGVPLPPANFREYSILTADGVTALCPRDRTEPIWDRIQELKSSSMGEEWIPVA